MFSLTNADNEWTSLTRCNQRVGMFLVDQHDHICADDTLQCDAHRFLKTNVIICLNVFNEFQKHLRICIAGEGVTFIDQFLFEEVIVFNDAVMDHGEFAVRRNVRMRIAVARFAVCSPSGMSDSAVGVNIFAD